MNNKDLLRQYVDTGLQLPEYQVKSLTPNLKKTYIRKRLIAVEHTNEENDYPFLEDYEIELLTPEQKVKYSNAKRDAALNSINNPDLHGFIHSKFWDLLTPNERFQGLLNFVESGYEVSDDQFKSLTPEQRYQAAIKMVEKGRGISNEKFKFLTPEQQNEVKFKLTMKNVENGHGVGDEIFKMLTPEQRFQVAMKLAEKNGWISDDQFKLLTPEQQKIIKDKHI